MMEKKISLLNKMIMVAKLVILKITILNQICPNQQIINFKKFEKVI